MTEPKIEVVNGQWPPNIDVIDKKFQVKDKSNILYAYGGKVWNPQGLIIPDHLMVHEGVHIFRQGRDPDRWWENYIKSPVFRLDEELYSHRSEWAYYVEHNKDRNERNKYLHFMCQRLAGPLYDNMITVREARNKILMISLEST